MIRTKINKTSKINTVRHDAPYCASWRTMPIPPVELDFLEYRHDASTCASRRTSHVRHDARQCVMTDYTKLFCLSNPGANSRVPSWHTTCCVTTDYTSPSQRTIVRHGGPCKNNFPQFPEANSDPSVMTVGYTVTTNCSGPSWRQTVRHDALHKTILWSWSQTFWASTITTHQVVRHDAPDLKLIFSS